MRVSLSGLNNPDSVFGQDKYLKVTHNKKNGKYSIVVKDDLTTTDKVSRFFSNLFGTECRNISRILNSPEGQERLKKISNKEVLANLDEINKEIEKLNKKILVKHIPLINIPNLSKKAPLPKKTANKLVVNFYTNDGKDIENRRLNDIWGFSHNKKESAHNYIQWLFPLTEVSKYNSKAPKLTTSLIDEMLSDPNMQTNLKISLDVMLDFYGLEWNEDKTEIKMSDSFEERAKVWLKKNDHNHLRITRILKCLRLFQLDAESAALFACLEEIKTNYPDKITDAAFKFWSDSQR